MIHQSGGFHESYYDHACQVVTERDILDIYIRDVSLLSALKKKWYNLFLLSYSDERAGYLYNSTHAMKQDRARHFQMHLGSIHPLSTFRKFWDMFILHVCIMHQILVYLNTTILLRSVPILTCYIAIVLEGFMIGDIIINARTGFIDKFKRTVELDKSLVLRNYCSNKLFFHAASSIPLVFILFLRYGNEIGCTLCKANYFNCVISFLTIINLFRVYELSSYWERGGTAFTATVFCRIGVNIILIAIQLVHCGDVLSLIHVMKTGTMSAAVLNSTSFSFFDEVFFYLHTNITNDITDVSFLNLHFRRVVTFLGRPRFGLIDAEYKYYALIYPHPLLHFIAYSITFFISSWLILKIFYLLIRKSYFDDEIHKNEGYLLNLVKSQQLPEQTYSKMNNYYKFPATKIKVIENVLNKSLPNSLNQEIAWQCFSRAILRIPYFSGWPREIVEKIVCLVEEHIFLENDVVAEAGMEFQGLMIVDAGLLAVYVHKEHHFDAIPCYKEMEHLIDGDYFGQGSLVTDREVSSSTVVAITTCKMLFLEKTLFRQLMRNSPNLFYSLQEELKNDSTKPK